MGPPIYVVHLNTLTPYHDTMMKTEEESFCADATASSGGARREGVGAPPSLPPFTLHTHWTHCAPNQKKKGHTTQHNTTQHNTHPPGRQTERWIGYTRFHVVYPFIQSFLFRLV